MIRRDHGAGRAILTQQGDDRLRPATLDPSDRAGASYAHAEPLQASGA